jgi:cytochrome c peroxidase
MMSGGRKPVQGGVRVNLPERGTWDSLAQMTPEQNSRPRAAAARIHAAAPCQTADWRQVFPNTQIDEIHRQEGRDLRRFDVDFDIPDRFTPEFPAPIYLTTHPESGDVSHGQVLTIKNYYTLMVGILTPVQIEGTRLLLTPFPQEEFNQTEDRTVADQSLAWLALTAIRISTPTQPSTRR